MSNEQPPKVREAILAAARDLLESEGPDGVALRAVARAVALPIGNVQHYFPTKEALVNEVIGRSFADLVDLGEELAVAAAGPFDLDGFVRRLYERARSRKTAIRLNLLDTIGRGSMHAERRAELGNVLQVANLFSPAFGGADLARMAVRTTMYTVARYAITDDDELRAIIDAKPDVEMVAVHERVLAHLIAVVRGLMVSR